MRHPDAGPPDDEILVTLELIDAALAGEPVDPEHAELAELALILADERPRPDEQFAVRLDQRAKERFASPARRPLARRLAVAPAGLVVVVSAIVAVVVLSSGGARPPVIRTLPGQASGSAAHSAPPAAPAAPAVPANAGSGTASSTASGTASSTASGSAGSAAGSSVAPGTTSTPSPTPTPTPNGQRIVSSAQLSLSTAPDRIEQVAQQLFDVVGAANGNVIHSTVTAADGMSGFADFQLSVPSATLPQTMAQLSRLRGASVVSRTDATLDITGSFVSTNRRLVDARVLRAALLTQLANAVTTGQIDSLRARIRDAEASIASDLATLNNLRRQVGFSQISITISTSPAPHPVTGGGFTIGRAAHDAGRVLTVAAGVALIVLAVLLPISVLAGIAGSVVLVSRRRRREQALDLI
jgi:Domain of unknown function (DUF4349)